MNEIFHEFFRLLYAIAKIASITARIIALLDFISAVQDMIHFIYHFVHLYTCMSCHVQSDLGKCLAFSPRFAED